jgi:uncharacterized protein
VSILYADSSALARAYFADEPDHAELKAMLLDGPDPVVASDLARVELASAVEAAARTGRLRRSREVLARFDVHCHESGPITLLRLRPETVLPAAYRLILDHQIRTLDAIHLAVALTELPGLAGEDEAIFVTRDTSQAVAARTLGLQVR